MTTYSYEERDKAYALINQMQGMTDLVEQIGKGKADPNPDLQAALANMTGATDLERQHKALTSILTRIKTAHEDRLFAAAPSDFSCYIEVINPEEPVQSDVHRFLADYLMTMEEEPGIRAAVSMPPGHAKDLDVETPVLMGDGTSKRLGDIEIGDFVITHTGNSREVLEVHDQGVRDILVIKTMAGRILQAHPDHPFLTPSGWIPAKELVKGDVLAQQREFSIANTSGRTRDEFIMAGYMMAAGMVRGRVYSRVNIIDNTFRTDDGVIMDDVMATGERLGYTGHVRQGIHYGGEVRTAKFQEPFRYWLETNELWGQQRRTMRVPEWVFKGSFLEIGAFLGALFSMDANLVPKRSRHTGGQRQMNIRLRNKGLTEDLRNLMMRLGARAVLRSKLEKNYNYEPTMFYNVVVPWDEDMAFLRRALRIVGDNNRFWENPIPVRRFFDARYGEDMITDIHEGDSTETRCLTVDEDHSFLADGVVVHNSTYCSRLFPSWWLGKRENKRWLQGGHTQRFAEKEFGKKTRDQILEKPAYQRVFPGVGIRSASVDEIVLTNDCSYVVKGVGQGISGYRSHFNNIDDPYPTEKAAQSEVTRNAVWEWFINDFRTRRLPGAGELIIVTRWHADDIVGRLEELMAIPVDEGGIDPWKIINLPAFSLGEEEDELNRKKDAPLWPELFNRGFLLDTKAGMNLNRWESLYQGSPVLTEGNVLQRKWIKNYERIPKIDRSWMSGTTTPSKTSPGDPANPMYAREYYGFKNRPEGPYESLAGPKESINQNPVLAQRIVISVDSAEKETTRADFSSIQCWILGDDKNHYLVDNETEKLDFPKLVKAVEKMAVKWGAHAILMEEKGAGNQYIQARSGLAPCPVIGINPGRMDKAMRFDGTMILWESGRVWLPATGADWLPRYINELLVFPNGKKDDQVDATSQYLNWSQNDGGWKRGTKKVRM